MLFRALAFMALAASALYAQEKVAVLPPQGGRSVSEINKKTVRSAFLDFLSEPSSGYIAHDRNHTDQAVMEPSGRTSPLYDEKTAKDVGKKLGVQLVCIIDLTREENDFLIECKLIVVETGLARSKSEIVSGVTNTEIKKASETVVRRLMAKNVTAPESVFLRDRPAATDQAAANKAATANDHAAANKAATPEKVAPRTAAPAAKPLLDDDIHEFDAMWVVGFSIAGPTGDTADAFNIGFGASCSFELQYFRARAGMTYFRANPKTRDMDKRPSALYSYTLGAEGVYRFGALDGGFYVFGGVLGIGGDIDFKNLQNCGEPLQNYKLYRETGFGIGFSAGFGYNFKGQFGLEASYTSANLKPSGALKPYSLDWAQASIKFRF
jgi:hypothetical protein